MLMRMCFFMMLISPIELIAEKIMDVKDYVSHRLKLADFEEVLWAVDSSAEKTFKLVIDVQFC
jgi:hypothetical protein